MTFASDLKGFSARTKEGMDSVVRQAVVLAAQGLIMKSPVGNPDLWKVPREGYVGGRLRANWTFGVGSPDVTTSENIDPTGAATLGRITSAAAGIQGGQVYYVANSLPYMQRIEYGWSTQSPSGVVRVTFAELPGAIEQYAASIRK